MKERIEIFRVMNEGAISINIMYSLTAFRIDV